MSQFSAAACSLSLSPLVSKRCKLRNVCKPCSKIPLIILPTTLVDVLAHLVFKSQASLNPERATI